jgi:nitroreductase
MQGEKVSEFVRLIKERRSVREYSGKKIGKEVLEDMVDCARLAPSSRNIQPWYFVVITEEAMLSKISELPVLGSPFIKNAAACIAICGKMDVKRHIEDCCLAAENIMLAAKAHGIGSCYVAALNKDVDEAAKLIGTPGGYEIVCFISLGYPKNDTAPPKKKPLKEVIVWEKF